MQIDPLFPQTIDNFLRNRHLYGPIWEKTGLVKDMEIEKKSNYWTYFWLKNRQLSRLILRKEVVYKQV